MGWTIEISQQAEHDLSAILDFLYETHLNLGDEPSSAFERAAARIIDIRNAASGLAAHPYIGTLREDIGSGLRTITKSRAIIWFELDEERETVRVLAFFFGGQDHIRHMLVRIRGA